MNRAVFLDRDGILNLDKGYTFKVADLSIPVDVPAALSSLKSHGFKLIVVTNQSGVARGRFTIQDVAKFNQALESELVRNAGPQLDLVKVCPHHPDGSIAEYSIQCRCRKPGTLLVEEACTELQVDPASSFFIGDKWSDVLCAVRSGVQPLLVQAQGGLRYDLPDGVFIGSNSRNGVRVVNSSETGPVELHSSVSSAASSLLSGFS